MANPLPLLARSPESPSEWDQYFSLRWRVLREPWEQPPGSERDLLEADSFHVALWEGETAVAGGRLHFNSPAEAQIRYMAVAPEWQRHHLGSRILGLLEAEARRRDADQIVLNAREEATGFYRGHDYEVTGPAGMLFGSIPHLRMVKMLREPPL